MSISRIGAFATLLIVFSSPSFAAGAGADQPPSFIGLKDGDTVTSPVTVKIMPATGPDATAGSHTHLIVDSPLPKAGVMIPMDATHVHMMGAQPQTSLTLPPGDHTLQLVLGGADHQIKLPLETSDLITIHVAPKP
jgi:hypothetical protein